MTWSWSARASRRATSALPRPRAPSPLPSACRRRACARVGPADGHGQGATTTTTRSSQDWMSGSATPRWSSTRGGSRHPGLRGRVCVRHDGDDDDDDDEPVASSSSSSSSSAAAAAAAAAAASASSRGLTPDARAALLAARASQRAKPIPGSSAGTGTRTKRPAVKPGPKRGAPGPPVSVGVVVVRQPGSMMSAESAAVTAWHRAPPRGQAIERRRPRRSPAAGRGGGGSAARSTRARRGDRHQTDGARERPDPRVPWGGGEAPQALAARSGRGRWRGAMMMMTRRQGDAAAATCRHWARTDWRRQRDSFFQ
eukprot:scaffold436_cov367-Prasinococcus_capsulatus_cf.AAC.1